MLSFCESVVRVLLSSSIRGARHLKAAHDPVFFGVFWKYPGPHATHGVVALESSSTVPAAQTNVLHGAERPVVFIPPCPAKRFNHKIQGLRSYDYFHQVCESHHFKHLERQPLQQKKNSEPNLDRRHHRAYCCHCHHQWIPEDTDTANKDQIALALCRSHLEGKMMGDK